jgi:hypothetical protein
MGKRGRPYRAVDGRGEGQIRITGGGRRSSTACSHRDVINRLWRRARRSAKDCQSVQERRP